MTLIYIIISFYFFVAATAVWVTGQKKKGPEKRELWLKNVAHLILVAFMLSILTLWTQAMFWAGILISLGGLLEIGTLVAKAPSKRWPVLLVYLPLAMLFCLFCLQAPFSPLVLYTYLLVLMFDGFSQISGQLFGPKKGIPDISPQKTVAGMAGGIIGPILTSFLIQPVTRYNFLYTFIVLIFAFGGTAAAAALKRSWHIKYYSSAIPGYGGFIDRFASLMSAGAALQLLILSLPDGPAQEIITF